MGKDIALVFQDPMTALNPVMKIGRQVAEVMECHLGKSRKAAARQAVALLEQVGVPMPERRAGQYPHQLSGGLRQRVAIAAALACSPQLLIADEPTTALDVSVQAQILDLLAQLQKHGNMSMILISHDFGVVAKNTHETAVMYAGKIVEHARTRDLFHRAKGAVHPRPDGRHSPVVRSAPCPASGHPRRAARPGQPAGGLRFCPPGAGKGGAFVLKKNRP